MLWATWPVYLIRFYLMCCFCFRVNNECIIFFFLCFLKPASPCSARRAMALRQRGAPAPTSGSALLLADRLTASLLPPWLQWFFFFFGNNPYWSDCMPFWDQLDFRSLRGCRHSWLRLFQLSALHPFVSRLWWIKQLDVQQHPPSSLCHCLCLTSTCPHFMLKYVSSGCMVIKHAVGTFL